MDAGTLGFCHPSTAALTLLRSSVRVFLLFHIESLEEGTPFHPCCPHATHKPGTEHDLSASEWNG